MKAVVQQGDLSVVVTLAAGHEFAGAVTDTPGVLDEVAAVVAGEQPPVPRKVGVRVYQVTAKFDPLDDPGDGEPVHPDRFVCKALGLRDGLDGLPQVGLREELERFTIAWSMIPKAVRTMIVSTAADAAAQRSAALRELRAQET